MINAHYNKHTFIYPSVAVHTTADSFSIWSYMYA